MTPELLKKIEKYKKAAMNATSEVEKSQYNQLVRELEAQMPKPTLHILEDASCQSCQ